MCVRVCLYERGSPPLIRNPCLAAGLVSGIRSVHEKIARLSDNRTLPLENNHPPDCLLDPRISVQSASGAAAREHTHPEAVGKDRNTGSVGSSLISIQDAAILLSHTSDAV